MPPETPTPVFTPVEPYRTHNFALLHARGLAHVFDTMRYERAFLVRQTDLRRLVELAQGDGLAHVNARLTLLLGKCDYKGPTKASWTTDRLLSTMELQLADDAGKVYEWAGQVCDFALKVPLKFRSDVAITGPLSHVLIVMFMNQAMPCDEGDSHQIERAFYGGNPEISVRLTKFVPSEGEQWRIPAK